MAAAFESLYLAATQVIRMTGRWTYKQRDLVTRKDIETKQSKADLVTYVDRSADERLRNKLSRILPGSGFVSEEMGEQNPGAEFVWIIDPVDGTTNFVYGLPIFSISVALRHGSSIIMGWVYDVCHDRMYRARSGRGAFSNGKRVRVRPDAALSEALLATGFAFRHYQSSPEFIQLLEALLRQTQGVRRLGSAALDLAYTSAGRFSGFFETNLNVWDVAAGSLLVREAGGVVTDFYGGQEYLDQGTLLASTPALHPILLEMLSYYFKPPAQY